MSSTHLDMPIHRETRRTLDQTSNLRSTEVLRHSSQFRDIHVGSHDSVGLHLVGVNVEDLKSTVFVWKGDFHVDFESTWSKESFVDHVETVGHSDDEDVVELVDSVHLQGAFKW